MKRDGRRAMENEDEVHTEGGGWRRIWGRVEKKGEKEGVREGKQRPGTRRLSAYYRKERSLGPLTSLRYVRSNLLMGQGKAKLTVGSVLRDGDSHQFESWVFFQFSQTKGEKVCLAGRNFSAFLDPVVNR